MESCTRCHHPNEIAPGRSICIECRNKARRETYAKDPSVARDIHLRRTYGITLKQYSNRLGRQGGCCAICRRRPGTRLNVDHDHALPKGHPRYIRGLLCSECNTGLGNFRDHPGVLVAAAEYLERTK